MRVCLLSFFFSFFFRWLDLGKPCFVLFFLFIRSPRPFSLLLWVYVLYSPPPMLVFVSSHIPKRHTLQIDFERLNG